MIALARVDDRLVHGQVTAGWVPHLHASRLVVVSDRLAADPIQSAIIAAGSSGIPVEVLGVAEAARRHAASAWDRDATILLFESLQEARRTLDAGLRFERLNLGGLRHEQGRVCLCEAITLDGDDCSVIADLRGRGVDIDVRLMPCDRNRGLPELPR